MTITSLRIGTRASQLALWQANWVADRLKQFGVHVELVDITTSGDEQQVGPIASLGTQGVFTKEIQSAVLDGRVDLAVHSLKDLPTETVDGLVLAAVPEREAIADAFVSGDGSGLDSLAEGARVGTGSLRRQAQLLHLRPDIQVSGIRGNVDTRLKKLDTGEYDAIVLATAGLIRLGLADRISELLEPPKMLPAVGQGALGLECAVDNKPVLEVVGRLNHSESRSAVDAERAMLAMLHGGCSAPVGAWGRIEGNRLLLDGLVASLDGKNILRASIVGETFDSQSLGKQLADELLSQGAAEIIAAART